MVVTRPGHPVSRSSLRAEMPLWLGRQPVWQAMVELCSFQDFMLPKSKLPGELET